MVSVTTGPTAEFEGISGTDLWAEGTDRAFDASFRRPVAPGREPQVQAAFATWLPAENWLVRGRPDRRRADDDTASPQRNASLDLGRFLAAFGIVWAHAGAPGATIGYTSLGLFLILTGYLAVGSYLRDPGPGFWASRARRILVPWLFWCLVFRILHEVVGDHPFVLLSDPFSLLIGPEIHLWFLPAAMLALIFVPALAADVRGRSGLVRAMAALAVLSAFLGVVHLSVGPMQGVALPAPFPQWAFALPLYLWGVIHALAVRRNAAWITLGGAVLASALTWIVAPDLASVQMILAALVFETLRLFPLRGVWAGIALRLGGLAFGIYLMHPIFTLFAYKFFGADLAKPALALFSFGGAMLATAVLHRLPIARKLA